MEGIYGHYDATSQSVSTTSDVMMTTHTKHSIPDNRAMRMSHAGGTWNIRTVSEENVGQ